MPPPKSGAEEAYPGELHERFQQAAVMLHAGQPAFALEALERVLDLAPQLPEGHANAGFALLALGRPQRAMDEFARAIDLRAGQANAYYGMAMAYEQLGDIASALGAMRTFVHLASEEDRHRQRALAAIWEWTSAENSDGAPAASVGRPAVVPQAAGTSDS